MSKTLAEVLLDSLAELIDRGSILIDKDERLYIELIDQNFPFAGSKIDWSAVDGSIFEQASHETFVSDCKCFVKRVLELELNEVASDVRVAMVGDGVMDLVLITEIRLLEKVLEQVLEFPQHIYLIPLDANWCFSFTMEGNMAFGQVPKL